MATTEVSVGQIQHLFVTHSPPFGQEAMAQSTRDAILALRKDKKAMDVFETPESDEQATAAQTSSYYTGAGTGSSSSLGRSDRKKNEDVLQLDLKPAVAFAKFAGKIYDSKLAADSSSSGSNSSSATAKVQPLPFARPASPTAFSTTNSSSSSPFESPIDKFNRLKREVTTFRSDLAALVREDGGDSDVGELAALLDRELGKLDEQLTGLTSEGATRKFVADGQQSADGADNGGPLVTQLIQRLQQSSSTDNVSPITFNLPTASSPSPSSTTTPDPSLSAGIVSSLDRRVAALEQTVGLPVGLITAAAVRDKSSASASRTSRSSTSAATSSPATSSSSSSGAVHLSYSSAFPDLYTGVMSLHRKLGLLDAARMDALRSHIKSITQDMELIAPSGASASAPANTAATSSSSSAPSSAVIDVRESGRVSELYDLMTRWDAWVGQLPVIVGRLHSLKATHDELRGVADRVKRVEADSAAIDKLLRDDRDALQKVSSAATASLDQMTKNLTSMQQRMAALQSKVDALNTK